MNAIEKIYEQARENAKNNGNHLDYEISKLVQFMDYQDLIDAHQVMPNRVVDRAIRLGWNPQRRTDADVVLVSQIRSMMIQRHDNPREFVQS